ncbi:MAG TPA: SGNH/GDSL hydrolase family protein, partial [Nocardioides sp.]|nr:SGNH/GDSL hydrolase family protein [Nocardioides sp.]
MRVLMLGDSHFDRLHLIPWALSRDTVNLAVGGAIAPEMLDQLGDLDPRGFDVVMLSIGSNDAATRPLPLEEFLGAIGQVLDRCEGRRVVLATAPGVAPRSPFSTRVQEYAAAAAALVRSSGGTVLETSRVLRPLGDRGLLPDGVHLTKSAHLLYVPALRRAA